MPERLTDITNWAGQGSHALQDLAKHAIKTTKENIGEEFTRWPLGATVRYEQGCWVIDHISDVHPFPTAYRQTADEAYNTLFHTWCDQLRKMSHDQAEKFIQELIWLSN